MLKDKLNPVCSFQTKERKKNLEYSMGFWLGATAVFKSSKAKLENQRLDSFTTWNQLSKPNPFSLFTCK